MSCIWCIPSKNYLCRFHNGSNGARMDPKPRVKKQKARRPAPTLMQQSIRNVSQVDPSKQFRDGTSFPPGWDHLSGSMKRVLQHQHRGSNVTKSSLSLEDVDAFVSSL